MAEDAQSSINEIFILLGLGLVVILLRLYARWDAVGFSEWGADDYLMILAMGIYTAESTLAYQVVHDYGGLANNGMTDAQRASLSPNSDEFRKRVRGSQTQLPGWVLYVMLLWIIKAALCTMFLRLTDRLDNYRTRIYIGFGLISTTWLIVTLSILLGCTPIQKNWQISPDPGLNCQPAVSRINVFVTLALNVATDIYLLTIPVPMLWSARIPIWKKCGLIILFSGGIFVTMAGILRCALILANDVTGAEDGSAWAVRESFVAVVTSNVPLIFPLVRKCLGKTLGSSSGSKYNKSRSRATGQPPGSIPLSDRSRSGKEDGFSNGGDTHAFVGSRDAMDDAKLEGGPTGGIKVEMAIHVRTTTKQKETYYDSDSDA